MTAAAFVAEAIVFAVVVLALLRRLDAQARQHARREDLLLNQLLHAAGKPWQPAPADTTADREPDLDDEPQPRWTATPEQFLD